MENWWSLRILKNSLLFGNWFLIHKRLFGLKMNGKRAEQMAKEEIKWIIYSSTFLFRAFLSFFFLFSSLNWTLNSSNSSLDIRISDDSEKWMSEKREKITHKTNVEICSLRFETNWMLRSKRETGMCFDRLNRDNAMMTHFVEKPFETFSGFTIDVSN